MKRIFVGAGIFAAGMLTHKRAARLLSESLARERNKDGYASMDSRYAERKREHPKTYKIARFVANVVMFFI